MLRDQENRWWVGSGTNAFFTSDPKNEKTLIEFEQYNDYPELRSSKIIHFLEEGSNIWIASNSGLYLLDKDKGIQQRYWQGAESPYKIPSSNIFYLYKDSANHLWLATVEDGLIQLTVVHREGE